MTVRKAAHEYDAYDRFHVIWLTAKGRKALFAVQVFDAVRQMKSNLLQALEARQSLTPFVRSRHDF